LKEKAMFRRAVLSALGALAIVACAPTAAPAAEGIQNVEITLSRSACFGHCPAYTVSIRGDGSVTYEGGAYVNVTGRQTARISQAEVQRLVARFDEIGFNNLRDEYRAGVTDVPTYIVSIERNGRRKQVVDYFGLDVGMPRAVRELQDEIDRVAGTDRWVLRNGQRITDPPPL
jgi:hypothetical protein